MKTKTPGQELRVRDHSYQFLILPKALFKLEVSVYGLAAYIALKYYAQNSSAACERMSVRTLANLVRISETTMKAALAELEKKGAIRVHQRSSKSPKGKRIPLPNLYELVNLMPTADDPLI